MSQSVNADSFVHLVRALRTAQKTYFKTRSQDVLQRSMRLEKAVDDALRELAGGGQQQLFPEPERSQPWPTPSKPTG